MSALRDARLARTALVVLALGSASVGVPATFAPRGFYDGYPFVANWVDRLPPFNEHLVTDVGGLFLAFAILFAWAAVTLRRELVVPLCAAWSVSALLHLVFHARHLDGFSVGDAVGELLSLAVLLVLPAIAIWALPVSGALPDRRGATVGRPRDGEGQQRA